PTNRKRVPQPARALSSPPGGHFLPKPEAPPEKEGLGRPGRSSGRPGLAGRGSAGSRGRPGSPGEASGPRQETADRLEELVDPEDQAEAGLHVDGHVPQHQPQAPKGPGDRRFPPEPRLPEAQALPQGRGHHPQAEGEAIQQGARPPAGPEWDLGGWRPPPPAETAGRAAPARPPARAPGRSGGRRRWPSPGRGGWG